MIRSPTYIIDSGDVILERNGNVLLEKIKQFLRKRKLFKE